MAFFIQFQTKWKIRKKAIECCRRLWRTSRPLACGRFEVLRIGCRINRRCDIGTNTKVGPTAYTTNADAHFQCRATSISDSDFICNVEKKMFVNWYSSAWQRGTTNGRPQGTNSVVQFHFPFFYYFLWREGVTPIQTKHV